MRRIDLENIKKGHKQVGWSEKNIFKEADVANVNRKKIHYIKKIDKRQINYHL